jgi:hypothetical protein
MREGKWNSFVAAAVDEYGEGAVTKAFFPPSVGTDYNRKLPYSQSLQQ